MQWPWFRFRDYLPDKKEWQKREERTGFWHKSLKMEKNTVNQQDGKKLTRQTGIFWIIWATWTNLNTYSLSRRIIDEKSSLFTLLRRLYCKNLREVKKESKKIKYINLLSGYILVYKCFLIECISDWDWTEYIRSK